jgi:hypothetical protein
MKQRVNPQPGQSRPVTRFMWQSEGSGVCVPGQKIVVSPLVDSSADVSSTAMAMTSQIKCCSTERRTE